MKAHTPRSVMPDARAFAVPLFGYASVVCWCLIFCPQLAQNYRQGNAVGLSAATFLLWAFTGFGAVAYIVHERGDVSLIVQWMLMSATSLGVVLQIYGYETFKSTSALRLRWAQAALATSCWAALFLGWLLSMLYVFRAWPAPGVVLALGVILPSITVAVGFFPQIWEFRRQQSGEAYSSGLVLLDLGGCIFAMCAWILQGQGVAGLIPYIVIICLQLVMMFLKHVWYDAKVTSVALVPPEESCECPAAATTQLSAASHV